MKNHNKILIITLLLTLLAVGCKKDSYRIRLFAEPLFGNKVLVNTTYPDGAWAEGETINVNGRSYPIQVDNNGGYFIEVTTSLDNMVALYPATLSSGGNEVEVTNTANSRTITPRSLAVNFQSGGGYEVCFPMAAVAESGNALQFRHLTGGLKINLCCTTNPCTIATIRVRLHGQYSIGLLAHPDDNDIAITTRWAVDGPLVPYVYWESYHNAESDLDVTNTDEMVFLMQTDGQAGVQVPASTDGITFMVPASPCNLKEIDVVGFDLQGEQLFFKQMQLSISGGVYPAIERNTVYTLPTIAINH